MTNKNLKLLTLAAIGAASLSVTPALAQTSEAAPALPAWLNKISLGGDIRLRLNNVDDNGKKNTNQYFRARVGVTGKVNDSLTANLRLSTAGTESGNVYTTSNQQFTDEGGKKAYFVDVASIDWKLMDGLVVTGGKAVNPFFTAGKNEMIWASDLTFEGYNVKYAQEFGAFKPFATLAHTIWTEGGNDQSDINLVGAQLGTGFKSESFGATIAAASYVHNGIKSARTSGFGNDTASSALGNSLNTTTGEFTYDYKLTNVEAEVTTDAVGIPLAAYGAWVKNSDPSSDNDGILYGLRAGRVKDVGSWVVDLSMRDVKKDAVVGTFADATFMGGGTDVKGTKANVQYVVATNTTLSLTGFFGNKAVSGANTDYKRYMLEGLVSF